MSDASPDRPAPPPWPSTRLALVAPDVLESLDPLEQELVALTRTLVCERRLDDASFDTARELLGETGLAELTWLVGYYSMLALALDVFAPENSLVEGVSASGRRDGAR